MKKSLFAITGLLTLATNASVMAASGEQSSGGLPQLNPETFTSQIFWLFVFFIILYAIMSYVALPKVSNVLERRREKVSNDLEDAKNLKEEALKLKETYESALAESHSEIKDLIKNIHDTVAKNNFDAHQSLTRELQELQTATEVAIENGKEKALKDLRDSATSIALELAGKLGNIAVNDNDAVEAVIAAQRKLDDAA